MRNLVVFITKNYFFFLFLLLETFCISILVQNNKFQRASFVNSSNQLSASVLSTSENIQHYFYLKTENERLAKENAELHSHDLLSFSLLVNGQYTINDTVYKQKYTFTNATVVNNSTNRRNNYLTLDKGSKQGITNKMGVTSSSGVVGIVENVSENFCNYFFIEKKSLATYSRSIQLFSKAYTGLIEWLEGLVRYPQLCIADTLVYKVSHIRFPFIQRCF